MLSVDDHLCVVIVVLKPVKQADVCDYVLLYSLVVTIST